MKPLFKEISFGLNAGDKKGLIAKNGAGKSTLMQILVGRESADAGRVVLKNGITLAYLDQSDLLDESQTILETIFDSKKPVMRLLAALPVPLRSALPIRIRFSTLAPKA